ncbi:MAG: STAS/SEC14 domain-containing protein [Erythrobacter sp.]|uniref:STAS/SEC14 domain-containing protein n=1 Tax=Erythrobacter sp. TaxID=1042 RepID=UPI0026302E09|nr:STAS/SEC14 domain-containing protein [Erythrobacter sp.]MDJ0978871.1 STAS/SEC14 domain-containing protein [Erythrobacter sp.]
METLAPTFTVSRDEARREILYSHSGLFTSGKMEELFVALLRAAKPFIDDRQGFRVLGDLREMVVQTREVADKLKLSQDTSAKVGVDKMAILYRSTLMKQQFRRASDALQCEFFTDRAEALAWLRTD